MLKSIHIDHHDTSIYIPMYHRTHGFTGHEREIYQSLKWRLFYEGRVVNPSYLGDQPNILPTFAAIRVDCLLDMDEKIYPVNLLEFFEFFVNEFVCTLSNGLSHHFKMAWTLTPTSIHPLHEEYLLIRDALFKQRPLSKTRKVKGVDITLDPFQMVHFELKTNLMKWKIILSKNAISFIGNKDHPNACLCYMLYCLTIGKPFNLAYYIGNRMVSVTKSADMTLPYEMILTRLLERVRISHPYALLNDLSLVDYVIIPLSEKRVF
nr:hypothetical protein [Tanacetum cinerariifolium]